MVFWRPNQACRLAFAAILLACATETHAAEPALRRHLDRQTPLTLATTDGSSLTLFDEARPPLSVICFLGTECPLARLYGPRLSALAEQFRDADVVFVGVNSNLQDSLAEFAAYGDELKITFPLVKDYDQQLAQRLGATRTPEVFVIDGTGELRYHGRIDDQFEPEVKKSAVRSHDLRDALSELVAGDPVSRPTTTAMGCRITFRQQPSAAEHEITYTDQVVRILGRHCVECHREGEIGPFALTDYDEVVGWSDMIVEVVDQGRMPPWHASPGPYKFANARHMPDNDKQTLRDWVAAGSPYGDPGKLPDETDSIATADAAPNLAAPADLVLPMSDAPFSVPATGTVEYQYFVIDPGFETDRWIKTADVVPGNPAVVHHCIAFIRPPDGADSRGFGLLTAYVPGQRNHPLPAGFAQRVVAGSKLVLQMHYTPVGTPQDDLSKLEITFADTDQITHEVRAYGGIEQRFEIPPRTPNHRVDGTIQRLPRDGLLISMAPHMHVRGKSFELFAHRGTESETILWVPSYDFNWQHSYQLADPLPLADIDQMSFTAVFDNSADNPANPDPDATVTWGDQTWEEMAVAFVEVAEPLASATAGEIASQPSAAATRQARQHRAEQRRRAEAFADRYIARFDKNGDQQLVDLELPDSVRLFGFRRFDHNHDGLVDRAELVREARRRDLDD